MRGLFVGRFQPYHRGHHRFIESIADEVDAVVVGVGSAQTSHRAANPFTAGERTAMIHRSLAPLDTTTLVVPIADVDRYAVWVGHVESLVPPFEVVYSNNPLVERLFSEAGYEVREVEHFDRHRFRGTAIREQMRAGEPWRDLVPDPVVDVIEEVDGVARLRAISGGE